MIYEEVAPSPAFAPYIERFWAFSLEAHDPSSLDHVIVPDGTASLSITEPTGVAAIISLTGPALVAVHIVAHRGASYRGVRIRAGALRAFLGLDAVAVAGRRLILADLLPDLAGAMAARCTDLSSLSAFTAAFESLVPVPLIAPDAAVCGLADALIASDGAVALHDIMDGFGVGARQLRRRFVTETGLTPKAFSRLRRVRRACVDMIHRPDEGMAGISLDHGYADQPHLSRDVKAVFNMSPQMLTTYLRQISHLNLFEMSDLFKP